MAGNSALEIEDTSAEEQDFRRALRALSEAFGAKGFQVKPFRDQAWRDFCALPRDKKKRIMRDFAIYYGIYMPVLLEAGSPNEDGKLLWAALKKLNLRPTSDFFSQVEDEDIVEIYSPSNLQIFHNINFFHVCSYSFLEVFAYPFTELWLRDPDAAATTQKFAVGGFSGKYHHTISPDVPPQYLVEAFSEERYLIELRFRKFSPFYDENGAVAALAAVSRARLLSTEEYRQVMAEHPYIPAPPADTVVEVRFSKD